MRWAFVAFAIAGFGAFCFVVKQWFDLKRLKEELKREKK